MPSWTSPIICRPGRAWRRGLAGASAALTPPGTAKLGCTRRPPSAGDDVLPVLAQPDRLDGQLGVRAVQPDHVAHRRVAVEAQQQVRPGQLEDVHRVRLDDLPHVHQLAQQAGRPRQLGADDLVARLGRGQVMADRADAADALGDQRHLEEHAAFAELLEAAELVDVEDRPLDLALVVQVHGDLGVPLDAGYGLNHDFLCHTSLLAMPVQEFALQTRACGRPAAR